MYPRNAASPERIAIGPVILIADGTPQGSAVTITVRGQGGAEASGGGTTAYGATGVIVYYTPTQAETDFTSFTVIASKASCIPVCVTIVTSASATPGYAGTDQGKIANATATVNLSGTTVKTATDVETDTQDIQARLPAALVSGRMSSDMIALSGDTTAADNAEAFFDGTGYAGTNNVIPLVTVTTTATTATNLTNAPTNGDFTATMKTSIGTAVAASAVASVTAGVTVTTNNDKTGYALSAAGITAIWDKVITGTTTAIQAMRGFIAVLLGKASGLETTNAKYRNIADNKDVVDATVDTNGNRTAVTLDLT